MSIQWDSAGPRTGRTWIELARPLSGETLTLICVSQRVEGVWLHWIDGRTIPCTGADDGCPYHDRPREGELRWKGYFPAVKSVGAGLVYGEITEEAWKGAPLLRQLSDANQLRGVRIAMARLRGGERRPVRVGLPFADQVIPRIVLLPECPDVRAALAVLWEGGGKGNGKKEDKKEGD